METQAYAVGLRDCNKAHHGEGTIAWLGSGQVTGVGLCYYCSEPGSDWRQTMCWSNKRGMSTCPGAHGTSVCCISQVALSVHTGSIIQPVQPAGQIFSARAPGPPNSQQRWAAGCRKVAVRHRAMPRLQARQQLPGPSQHGHWSWQACRVTHGRLLRHRRQRQQRRPGHCWLAAACAVVGSATAGNHGWPGSLAGCPRRRRNEGRLHGDGGLHRGLPSLRFRGVHAGLR